MQSLANRGKPRKEHRDPSSCRPRLARWKEHRFVKAVRVPDQLLARKALVYERLETEIRRAQQVVGKLILFFLNSKVLGVVRMLVTGRQLQAQRSQSRWTLPNA